MVAHPTGRATGHAVRCRRRLHRLAGLAEVLDEIIGGRGDVDHAAVTKVAQVGRVDVGDGHQQRAVLVVPPAIALAREALLPNALAPADLVFGGWGDASGRGMMILVKGEWVPVLYACERKKRGKIKMCHDSNPPQ